MIWIALAVAILILFFLLLWSLTPSATSTAMFGGRSGGARVRVVHGPKNARERVQWWLNGCRMRRDDK